MGKNLSNDQKKSAKEFLMAKIGDAFEEEYRKLELREGLIETLLDLDEEELKKMCPVTFWCMVQHICPNLSFVAQKLGSIPASTAGIERVFSIWDYVHSRIRNRLGGHRSKQLVNIYFTLRSMLAIPVDEPLAFVN